MKEVPRDKMSRMSRNSGSDDSGTREGLVLPLTWHRVAFSYLGCPTAIIAVSLSVVTLMASALPLATVTRGWCEYTVTVFSLFDAFAFAGIIPLGAVLVLVTPVVSLLGQTYGRTLRGLVYTFIGMLMLTALVIYRVFFPMYTSHSLLCETIKGITMYYPFYLILVAASVFIAVGILEWLRRPALLFRPYVPPPPRPRRMSPSVPEVAMNCPQCGRQLPLEATFCDKCGKRITAG